VVICSAPTTSTTFAAPASIARTPWLHRRRAGGAGVLDAGRRLEAQRRIGRLQHEGGGEVLGRETRR
jgi:hypothetical protein